MIQFINTNFQVLVVVLLVAEIVIPFLRKR
jgi:hypothetical protein